MKATLVSLSALSCFSIFFRGLQLAFDVRLGKETHGRYEAVSLRLSGSISNEQGRGRERSYALAHVTCLSAAGSEGV